VNLSTEPHTANPALHHAYAVNHHTVTYREQCFWHKLVERDLHLQASRIRNMAAEWARNGKSWKIIQMDYQRPPVVVSLLPKANDGDKGYMLTQLGHWVNTVQVQVLSRAGPLTRDLLLRIPRDATMDWDEQHHTL
jgi:hypothetical protein